MDSAKIININIFIHKINIKKIIMINDNSYYLSFFYDD